MQMLPGSVPAAPHTPHFVAGVKGQKGLGTASSNLCATRHLCNQTHQIQWIPQRIEAPLSVPHLTFLQKQILLSAPPSSPGGRVPSLKAKKKKKHKQNPKGNLAIHILDNIAPDPVTWDHLIRLHVCVLPHMGDKEVKNIWKTMPYGTRGSVLWVRTQLSGAGTNKVASWKEKPQCQDSLGKNPATTPPANSWPL